MSPSALHTEAATLRISERATAMIIADALYTMTYATDPDEPEDRRVHRKARLEQIARMAVALVNEATEREAIRQAEVTFDDSLNGSERAALILDEDHSRFDLIQSAFLRLRQIIQNQKPISGALAVWRSALLRSR
jgi:hypothetical protein